MLKALNLSPDLLVDGSPPYLGSYAGDYIAEPGVCDAVVTWAPNWIYMHEDPSLSAWAKPSWEKTDAAVQKILSAGKRCFVACSSIDASDAAKVNLTVDYADRLDWVTRTIERYHECAIIVSNEPTFAGVHHEISAQLMRDTAEYAAGGKAGSRSTHLLGPAEADPVVTEKDGTQRLGYTPGVLGWLKAWSPPKRVRVDVAMHHYWDGVHGGAVGTRLALKALPDSAAWRPNLFLTEGFFTYATHKLPG